MVMSRDVREYWEARFRSKGLIWGRRPSESARMAASFMRGLGCRLRVLDIGCGYGRDLALFHAEGHDAVGTDICETAVRLGSEAYPELKLHIGDVLALPYADARFDVVYGNFISHLFCHEDRSTLVRECRRVLRTGGYLMETVASVSDPDFGKGTRCGEDTYLNSRGVVKRYYSPETLRADLTGFRLVAAREFEVQHTHDEPHVHVNLFSCAERVAEEG